MEFGVLGPLLVRDAYGIRPISAAKQRTLLATLLLNANTVVASEELTRTIWNGRSPGSPGGLYNHVMRLRTAMGPHLGARLRTQPPGYLIEVQDGELDLHRFTDLRDRGVTAARAAEWSTASHTLGQALALFRGSPLADIMSEAVLRAHQQAIVEARLQTLGWRIDADLRLGRHSELIAELRRLTADHPLREQFHAQLILALYRDGSQAEALACFRQLRDNLVHELGVEPTRELQQLHQRILRSDPDLDVAPPVTPAAAPARQQPLAQLPSGVADFTGRADQVARVAELLRGPGVPVVAVTGTGGIGKTTLALHVAHELRDHFPDGQLYAHLACTMGLPMAPDQVLAKFLRDLGVDGSVLPTTLYDRAVLFRSLLSDQRILVMLDDAASAVQVRSLLPGNAGSAVLVTARQTLADLEGCRTIPLETLDMAEAHALLCEIVGRERVALEPEAARDVLGVCAGLPLAVRIAGGRLAARPNWSIREIADRLADEHRRLDELAVGDLAVRATFEVSYANLTGAADAARAFRLLGAAGLGGISLPAAAALLDTSIDDAEAALELLVDSYLLESPTARRYRFHDLIRTYAKERAIAEEPEQDRRRALRRLLDWYVRTSNAASAMLMPLGRRTESDYPPDAPQPLSFASYQDAMEWNDTELTAIVVLVPLAADLGEHDVASQLPTSMWAYFAIRRLLEVLIETHTVALESARLDYDRQMQAVVLNHLGIAYADNGQLDLSLDRFSESMQLRKETDDDWGRAAVLNNLGALHLRMNNYGTAIVYHEQALEVFRQIHDEGAEAQTLNNLGEVWLRRGDVGRSIDCHTAAIEMFRRLNEQFGLAQSLDNLGNAYLSDGKYHEAIDTLEAAATLSNSLGDIADEATALQKLGTALRELGRTEEARKAWTSALPLLDQTNEALAADVREQLGRLDG
ncbi:MAG TPA: BTAD domain-containing putative transcriptional regulator [Pseudonocardiaceae bacterium]|jgi:DNA-binding SARP family transcriptional activator/Flp pilus assembly protein TadD